MARDLILGTAGHIDHGKTSLVKALTGIDCDRLPEEKRRGITIDIGFANLDLGEFNLGIVDVPGHERFVKNMLAGATGIDVALLVVAADDSVMPQTREHLDILNLIGLEHGVIALTKADLVDETTRELAVLEIRELVRDTFLRDAPIIPTSSATGLGIAELKHAIQEACRRLPPARVDGWFRLAVDRSFVVQGHGTVVTGSVTAGSVRIGDELAWHKHDGTTEPVRIRGLNRHNQPAEELHRGQRAAINLAGVPHDGIRRGHELATPGHLVPSRVLTVRLQNLAGPRRTLKHRLPVRLHLGAAETPATVSLLDADRLEPGRSGFAQLFLEEHITAVWGQPFIVRDSSAELTLGGGQVLQPTAEKLRRRHLEALEQVEHLAAEGKLPRALAAAWFAGFAGFQPLDWVRNAGVPPNEIDDLAQRMATDGTVVKLPLGSNRTMWLHRDRVKQLEEQILERLRQLHHDNPLHTTHDRQKALAGLDYLGDEAFRQVIVDRLLASKRAVGNATRVARADFKPKLSINQRKLKDRIVADHKQAGFAPPDPESFANLAGGNAAALKDIFEVSVAEGELVRVSPTLFLHVETEARMRQLIRERLASSPGMSVAEIRDLLGTTRKYAVPLCEYLDRCGTTKREGDLRVLATGPK